MFEIEDWEDIFLSLKNECEQGSIQFPYAEEKVPFTDATIEALEDMEEIEETNHTNIPSIFKKAILTHRHK